MVIDFVIPFARRLATRSWRRSMAKTLSWRLFATLDSFVISLFVTGNWKWAGSIVGIEALTKTGWYLVHERAWTRVPAVLPAPHVAPAARTAAPVIVSRVAAPVVVSRGGPTSFHRCLAVHLHYTANSGALR
jgi:uncharacterized membrane protein